MKRNIFISLVLAVVIFSSPIFALSVASRNALNAFRRYEPDFLNTYRRLEELDRKIDNQKIKSGTERYEEIMDEAEDKMEYIQRRYDLMEDLFTSVSSDYPADRAELFEGFSRIDDHYKDIRNFYTDNFVYRGQRRKKGTSKKTETKKDIEEKASVETHEPSAAKVTKKAEDKKVEVSGVLKLDFRNRNETYRTQTRVTPNTLAETALPNNLGQAKLSLTYKFDENRSLFIEDKFLRRERNEPVRENYLTASYLLKRGKGKAWTFKDTLHHAWYPDSSTKDYRNNLLEAFYNKRWGKRERLANIGYQTRFYPNYSRSDFHQMNFSDQETWFIDNGNIFADFTANGRRYRNIGNLDYDNFNLYAEYNKNYTGNKAELSVSNTFDRRLYDQESVNLYRASYYDNYFRVNYDLPVHKKLAYAFETEYQKRNYQADDPRGYAEFDLMAKAKYKFNKQTRGVADYKYTYNDENTRARAHKNHRLHGMWEKKVTKDFKVRIDDTYKTRSSVVGEVMDFKENMFTAKLFWNLRNKMKLVWNNEYLERVYDQLFYRDYRYFLSGLNLSYAKAKKYDWKLTQNWRKFSCRNGNNVSTGWTSETQPLTEVRFNVKLEEDLKLKLRASWEKSFYRSFDSLSQELLWDFTRPMTITEFYGGLEYTF